MGTHTRCARRGHTGADADALVIVLWMYVCPWDLRCASTQLVLPEAVKVQLC